MTKVLIIDTRSNVLSIVYSLPDVEIVGVWADSIDKKRCLIENYPDLYIFDSEDICNYDKTYVSQDEILQYKHTQLKVKKYINRFSDDESTLDLIYFTSLAFWLHIFEMGVECVFVMEQEHGSTIDSIPLDIAKSKGIPAFIFEVIFVNRTGVELLKAIHCYNNNKYLDVCSMDPSMNSVDLDVFFDKKSLGIVKTYGLNKRGKYFKYLLSPCSCVLRALCSIFGRNFDTNSFENKIFTLFFRIYWISKSCVKALMGKTHQHSSSPGIIYHDSAFELCHAIHHTKNIKKYYNSNAVNELMQNVNAIFYALHFEPEATIMNRTIYSNQIYNLKMLSAHLPDGWVIYVKEHPDQFNLFRLNFIDNAKYIHKYRSESYYSLIQSIPRVVLLNSNMSSSDILKMSEVKAVATINGTISLEAMKNGKKLILFDGKSMPYSEYNGICYINSPESLIGLTSYLESESVPDYKSELQLLVRKLIYAKTVWSDNPQENGVFNFDISKNLIQTLINNAESYASE